jgi:hypothetical protein
MSEYFTGLEFFLSCAKYFLYCLRILHLSKEKCHVLKVLESHGVNLEAFEQSACQGSPLPCTLQLGFLVA